MSQNIMSENSLENRKKKIIYRSWYRGCKETDRILGHYVKQNIERFDESQLDDLEEILALQDVDIYNWLSGKQKTPANVMENPIFKELMEFRFEDVQQ
jgi:antitoxin CptB